MLDADQFLELESGTQPKKEPYIKVPGEIDYRLRQLSYSSGLTLHSCPRKYQLYKLRASGTKETIFQTISNSFGHTVGLGTQLIFQDRYSLGQVLLDCFLAYPEDIFLEDEKAKKGFFAALACLSRLYAARKAGLLKEWVVMDYQGKPAIEFSFCISLPNGFNYRGYVDAVLVHKKTGKIAVLERKTTKLKNVDPAAYKNSAQALGYSIVLDHICPGLSSYEVLYLTYSSTTMEEIPFEFPKTFLQRAEWIQDLVFDCEIIAKYDEAELYPMRGENCFDFFRPCQYFQVCTLGISNLASAWDGVEDPVDYQINVTLQELIESQLKRSTS